MKSNKFSELILTHDLQPTRGLKQVLAFFSINPHQPIESIIRITQEKWLRGPIERWQIAQKTPITPQVHQLFSEIGMISALYPTAKHYDYILLLGSDYEGTRARINFLRILLANGIQTKQIVAIGSDRPLDINELRSNSSIGTTEIEMIKKLLESDESFARSGRWSAKREWRPLHSAPSDPLSRRTERGNVTFIEAKGKTLADGTFKRATTADTFNAWLASAPKPGSCLLISDQPFIGYQNAVAHSLLKNFWNITTVGPAIDNQTTLEDLLDTLARWLYQETNQK